MQKAYMLSVKTVSGIGLDAKVLQVLQESSAVALIRGHIPEDLRTVPNETSHLEAVSGQADEEQAQEKIFFLLQHHSREPRVRLFTRSPFNTRRMFPRGLTHKERHSIAVLCFSEVCFEGFTRDHARIFILIEKFTIQRRRYTKVARFSQMAFRCA